MYTPSDMALAQRIWDAKAISYLSEADQKSGREKGFIIGHLASNICNDVRHGWGVAGRATLSHAESDKPIKSWLGIAANAGGLVLFCVGAFVLATVMCGI